MRIDILLSVPSEGDRATRTARPRTASSCLGGGGGGGDLGCGMK